MRKSYLMCEPRWFDVPYSINPWMDPGRPVDRELAWAQWEALVAVLRGNGAAIELIEPVEGLPDMTFAGDCGMVIGRRFLRSNFRHPERQGEAAHYERWMAARGYEVVRVPEGIVFEGLGDVVYSGRTVLFGYGPRSDPGAAGVVARTFPELDIRGTVEICDDRFFHVALAAAPLSPDVLLCYPGAFTPASQDLLQRVFRTVIEVDDRDAMDSFVCNNIVLGSNIVLDDCSRPLEHRLVAAGYKVVRCPMGEFKKSGGSLRCLVLEL